LPWAIYDYQLRERGKRHALGLLDGIVLREQALTLGCVAHHEGRACSGGALVGSIAATKWFKKSEKKANLRKLRFAKNPALSAYQNSLVNLGFFITDEERPDTDEETELTFEDIELSELGTEIARRYDSAVRALSATRVLADKDRSCSLSELAQFGRRGGLCELSERASVDRDLLRDVFFSRLKVKGASHAFRRRSLLLVLELCRQFAPDSWSMDEANVGSAVYYGRLVDEDSVLKVSLPKQLIDIATRWRMFYFHYNMGVALEGLFAWVVSQVGETGLAGMTVESLVASFNDLSTTKNISDLLGIDLSGSLADLTPSRLYTNVGIGRDVLDPVASRLMDEKVGSCTTLAEDTLEEHIRSNQHLYSPVGLVLPLLLLTTTLARYAQWNDTNYGKWLAAQANDPYLDIVPPVVATGLSRRFGNWWASSFKDLSAFILSRYVIQQHQSLSYEKTSSGNRCLIQVDGAKVFSTGGFNKIGMGNPRMRSAIQILRDLGLVEGAGNDEDGSRLSREGQDFLKRELANETHEVP
jgi:hypothetical protein